MTTVVTIYNSFREYVADGTVDLDNDTLKLALVTSGYSTPSTSHTIWGDVSANEVAAGAGYTTGGASLTQTWVRAGGITTLDSPDITFTALTKTFRYGVIYANVTRGGIVNPLILYYLFDNTPADIVVAGVNWTVTFSAGGILVVS